MIKHKAGRECTHLIYIIRKTYFAQKNSFFICTTKLVYKRRLINRRQELSGLKKKRIHYVQSAYKHNMLGKGLRQTVHSERSEVKIDISQNLEERNRCSPTHYYCTQRKVRGQCSYPTDRIQRKSLDPPPLHTQKAQRSMQISHRQNLEKTDFLQSTTSTVSKAQFL